MFTHTAPPNRHHLDADLAVLDGDYLQDLLAQPKALADTVEGLGKLEPLPDSARRRSKVILTGMGSSLHALNPLQNELVRAGRTPITVETAELIYSQRKLLSEDALVVVVSQSGRSAETVSLLDYIDLQTRQPFVVGVTNTLDSPLATGADFLIPLHAGNEFSVSCKTYLSTLAALQWLGVALCSELPRIDLISVFEEMRSAGELVDVYLRSWTGHVRCLIDRLQDLRHLFITGRGDSLAAVETGALILKESTRFHAEGMSSPAFRHGPLEMVNAGLFALVFAGDATTRMLNERLVDDIAAAGGRAALVSETAEPDVFRLPRTSERLRPIMEMLPVQMISLALSVLAHRTPGVFERATKVTITE